MPQILNVDDACDIVIRWFGWKADLRGAPIAHDLPEAVETLNRRLGRLWHDGAPADLFESQDRLISPHRYQVEADGVVPIIWENQGVWGCGFRPDTGARLWVTGDWPDDQAGSQMWRATQDIIDTPIIFALLANAIWASEDCVMDELDEMPVCVDRLLWTFGPSDGFRGFWSDADMTLIRMQGTGWGVTARR